MNFYEILAFLAVVALFVAVFRMFDRAPEIAMVEILHELEPVVINFTPFSNMVPAEQPVAVVCERNDLPVGLPDYYTQALSLLSLAEGGDVEAQFQLAEIISHCEGINAWKPDFEHDFSHFKAMNVSVADLRYMDNLMLEVQNCAAFCRSGAGYI